MPESIKHRENDQSIFLLVLNVRKGDTPWQGNNLKWYFAEHLWVWVRLGYSDKHRDESVKDPFNIIDSTYIYKHQS